MISITRTRIVVVRTDPPPPVLYNKCSYNTQVRVSSKSNTTTNNNSTSYIDILQLIQTPG